MRKFTLFYLVLFGLAVFSCGKKEIDIKKGDWRGVILPVRENPDIEIPFNFYVESTAENKHTIIIRNADEKIMIDEIILRGDSLIVRIPVFSDEIKALIYGGDSLAGEYIHYGSRSSYGMTFFAKAGVNERFKDKDEKVVSDLTGRWETKVNPGDSNEYRIIGEFIQTGNNLIGTFLSASGDFRYLEGNVYGNKMMMSKVDGAHTVLFTAEISPDGNLINGMLIGGPNWKEKWTAKKNEKAELPDPEKVTELKKGYETIDFSFINTEKKLVSLKDEKFLGKAVVVQISGTWCPNCKDEAVLFAGLYENYQPAGLEVVSLNFESKDTVSALERMLRFKNQTGAGYEFLYAGEPGKNNVMKVLPALKSFNGYPTTIYMDRKHKVRKIYTGFSGPGTGVHYEKMRNGIIDIIEKVLQN
ncbi:MAG: TlpA family protein disulfide reductase [Ignavibacteria bacterium]|nr:TlpA family protein disulfide reductase [Ignavibacteria bacterium]